MEGRRASSRKRKVDCLLFVMSTGLSMWVKLLQAGKGFAHTHCAAPTMPQGLHTFHSNMVMWEAPKPLGP